MVSKGTKGTVTQIIGLEQGSVPYDRAEQIKQLWTSIRHSCPRRTARCDNGKYPHCLRLRELRPPCPTSLLCRNFNMTMTHHQWSPGCDHLKTAWLPCQWTIQETEGNLLHLPGDHVHGIYSGLGAPANGVEDQPVPDAYEKSKAQLRAHLRSQKTWRLKRMYFVSLSSNPMQLLISSIIVYIDWLCTVTSQAMTRRSKVRLSCSIIHPSPALCTPWPYIWSRGSINARVCYGDGWYPRIRNWGQWLHKSLQSTESTIASPVVHSWTG